MSNLETAVQLKAELDALRPLTDDQEKRIWQKFRFDWNYHSNNIEGNSLTFGETKSLLLHNITAQGKPLKDHFEITGHNEAIDTLVDLTRGDAPLTESFVRQLHSLILRERYQVDAITAEGAPTRRWIEVGEYKKGQNHVQTVTGEIFRFAEPMDVPGKMHALLQLIDELQAPSMAEVIFVAAKAHYDFVLIHPFDDGNGRMARLLMNLILIKYGFPPAIIKTQEKEKYFSALRQADGGQFEVFAEYIAGCICASMQIMLAGARGESIEEPDEQDRQIKMLEGLLQSKLGKLSTSRTVESIVQLFSRSFAPLALRLEAAAAKFSTLYLKLEMSVEGRHGGRGEGNVAAKLAYVEEKIDEATSSFTFTSQFSNLTYKGVDQFSHHWSVTFTLHPASYTVSATASVDPIERTYDRQLTVDELETIVKKLVKFHIWVIEQASGVNLQNM